MSEHHDAERYERKSRDFHEHYGMGGDDMREHFDVTFTVDTGTGEQSPPRRPDCTRTSGCLLPDGHRNPVCMVPNRPHRRK